VRALGCEVALGQVEVGPADAASLNADPELARTGLGDRAVDQCKGARAYRARFVYDPRPHSSDRRGRHQGPPVQVVVVASAGQALLLVSFAMVPETIQA
jgi:hypothetical protein